MRCGRCPEKAEAGYTLRESGGRVVRVCEACWAFALRHAAYPRPRHLDRRGPYQSGRGRT